MMDRLLRWVRDIRRAKFFDIQNVSDYFWEHTEEFWDLKQMTLAPPFDFFATRYTLPTRVYSKEHGWTDFPKGSWGSECLTVFRVIDHVPVSSYRQIHLSETDAQTGQPALVPGAKWHYAVWLFIALKRTVQPPSLWFMAVDELGRLATQAGGQPAFWIVESMADYQVTVIPVSYLHVSALALTFLHCKNVQVVDPPPPTKKRLSRKRKFDVRYHRLKVHAIGQRRYQMSGSKTDIKQSLHIVRGHFREYGPEYGKQKLFGKHSGRYWVSAHLAGDYREGRMYLQFLPPEKKA
jgi:hypothetical protein